MEALKKPVGYYDDLEISVEEAISNAALPDCLFYFKDLKQRKIFPAHRNRGGNGQGTSYVISCRSTGRIWGLRQRRESPF